MKPGLVEHIQSVYPDLIVKDVYVNEIGQNNDVLIVNDSLVFRFPKYAKGMVHLRRETEILRFLKGRLPLPIPEPIYYSFKEAERGKVFAGYRRIEGEPFWKGSLFEVQSKETVQRLAKQLASFLAELHAITEMEVKEALQLKVRDPYTKMHRLYEEIRTKLYPYIRTSAQQEISRSFEDFLKGESNPSTGATLVHGDFGASNILWDPEAREITGIIDFGGSGLGDPAYDFAGVLSSYGREFFELCLSFYPNGEGIVERVTFYRSTFALQEALHGIEHGDEEAFESGISTYQ